MVKPVSIELKLLSLRGIWNKKLHKIIHHKGMYLAKYEKYLQT